MYTRLLQSTTRLHPRAWDFIQLMRLDKPIGIYLLLWPTLWALWVAAAGVPSAKNLFIFVAGVILIILQIPHPMLMSAAGLLLPIPAALAGAWLVGLARARKRP